MDKCRELWEGYGGNFKEKKQLPAQSSLSPNSCLHAAIIYKTESHVGKWDVKSSSIPKHTQLHRTQRLTKMGPGVTRWMQMPYHSLWSWEGCLLLLKVSYFSNGYTTISDRIGEEWNEMLYENAYYQASLVAQW